MQGNRPAADIELFLNQICAEKTPLSDHASAVFSR
jgi:hypothetical protein